MRLFLSHAFEAKPRVRQIASALPAHIDIWLDQDEMATGVRFPAHIEEAIHEGCDFAVVFVDAAALASDWVRREVAMALERERDLQRPFLLPVLLDPVAARLGELGALDDRLYLEAFDATPEGHAVASRSLAEQLFALVSKAIETTRGEGRRGLLRAFARELTAFKNAAFLWHATLGDTLAVLSSNPQAFERVRAAVVDYNAVADRVIPQLDTFRDRLTAAWAGYRGLCGDVRAFTEFVEKDAYRGALFQLNDVHEMIHRLDLARASGAPAPATEIAALDARKETLRDAAQQVLDALTRKSTELIAELEREI